MTPKAISFTPEVLKAKLRALEEYGRCQTRRPCARPPADDWAPREYAPGLWDFGGPAKNGPLRSPFGAVGQKLWIRERARVVAADPSGEMRLRYELDGEERVVEWPDRIVGVVVGHCIPNGVFREGARHFLEVVEVRAERVAEVSEEDALLEGIERHGSRQSDGAHLFGLRGSSRTNFPSARAAYFALYDSICGAGAHARDWCWVYTLKRAAP